MALNSYDAVVAATTRRNQTTYTAYVSNISLDRDGTVTVDVTYQKNTSGSPIGETRFALYVAGEEVATKSTSASQGGSVVTLRGGEADGETEIRVEGRNDDLTQSSVASSADSNNGWTFGRTIQAPELQPAFRITSVDYPPEVDVGEQFQMSVSTTNVGRATGVVVVGGDGPSGSSNIQPGGEATVESTLMLSEPGRRTYTITATNDTTREEQTVNVPVVGRGADIALGPIRFPTTAPASEPFTGRVVVLNRGTASGRAQVVIDGNTQTVTLEAGQSKVVEHEAGTSDGGDQRFAVVVEDPETGERLGGDTVTVRRPINEFGAEGLLSNLGEQPANNLDLSFQATGPAARSLFGGPDIGEVDDPDNDVPNDPAADIPL